MLTYVSACSMEACEFAALSLWLFPGSWPKCFSHFTFGGLLSSLPSLATADQPTFSWSFLLILQKPFLFHLIVFLPLCFIISPWPLRAILACEPGNFILLSVHFGLPFLLWHSGRPVWGGKHASPPQSPARGSLPWFGRWRSWGAKSFPSPNTHAESCPLWA
jgi:hypothetical protein